VKLLLYSHYFAPSIGGVETIVMSLARGLAELRTPDGAREFELTLVTQTPREKFDDSSLPFAVMRQPGFWTLWRLVRSSDVLHVAGPALAPVILGLFARRAVVIEHHGFQTICPTGQLFIESRGEPCPGHFMAGRHTECWKCDQAMGWFGSRKLWLFTFVRRFLSKRVVANIMPTRWLGTQLNLPRATTIHHGLTRIESAEKIESHGARVPVIAFQGRLVTTKGARVLLEAAELLCEQKQEFSVVFIGDGPDRQSLEHLANQPPLLGRVQFTGKLAPAELEIKLREATVVVVPSLGGEVFGLVVAENMQRGLPVVASDLGSFVEVLGDTDTIFRTGDATDLATKTSELLQSLPRMKTIGNSGKDRANKYFQVSRMVGEHQLLYQQLRNRNSWR
jgi:glycogen(starch) synthase